MPIKHHELAILKSLHLYPMMTVKQITKLHYSKSSCAYVNKVLRQMADKKFLSRLPPPHVSLPILYTLGRAGVRLLRDEMDKDIHFYPSDQSYPSPIFLPHILQTTDTMIAIHELPAIAPGYEVHNLKHDLSLKRARKTPVRADIFCDIYKGEKVSSFWWEVDRGTKEGHAWKQKMSSLVQFINDPDYKAIYSEYQPTILIVTTGNFTRLNAMLRLTCALLEETYQKRLNDLFRFATISEGEVDPQRLFFEEIWSVPFESEKLRLLSSVEALPE